jgi:hypothetical protein
MTAPTRLATDDERAQELAAVIKGGDVARLTQLLAADPSLATCLVTEPDGGARTPLHLLADAPGGRPRSAETVRVLAAAGSDLNAPAVGMWHVEVPLHWAASNDDVELIDALLDAGADIERAGSSIDGGPPIQSALGYGQWRAVRLLYERGSTAWLPHFVVMGMTDRVAAAIERTDLTSEELSIALWNACRRGDLVLARMLIERGADPGWRAPWSGQTPAEIARAASQHHLLPWLGSAAGPIH